MTKILKPQKPFTKLQNGDYCGVHIPLPNNMTVYGPEKDTNVKMRVARFYGTKFFEKETKRG